MNKQDILKIIPSVDSLLKLPETAELFHQHGRSRATAAIRNAMKSIRDDILAGNIISVSDDTILASAVGILNTQMKPRLTRVVNATGIILHTGLGRASMPDSVRETLVDLTGPCNIQMDLSTGERIQRESCIKDLVRSLTGAEDAVLVNNNAGATMLVLKALAEKQEVVVSRGELIEIGGSFRLPEIMEQSGAILREVGSTNKTHLKDYEKAVNSNTALLFKAHKSNYCIVGFTKEVPINEIAALGKKNNITVVDDLGCGALVNLEDYGMDHEMTVRESLEAGSDIVLFSTDKLIGGPQGGLIVGRSDLLKIIRSHPLYRALRVCKMTLAALESTLRLFISPELTRGKHPVYRMLAKTPQEMEQQAQDIATLIKTHQPDWDVSIVEEKSYLGGGSVPAGFLPSFAVSITSKTTSAESISQHLRSADIPIIPHTADNAVLLNMRTVFQNEIHDIVKACKRK